MAQNEEIIMLRNEVNSLKEMVENIAVLINKKFIQELYGEVKNIEAGDYLSEEEFEQKHKIKIH
ncbi:hypothetical protein HYS72_00480 [Candidatus Pacearchaeota archaeon]|nr:hypothetical protein [Candidatus Pacearchaeota archaeon]MBI2056731.1 hypothetical protein [Candidatus Pacearchaeota archaeon]